MIFVVSSNAILIKQLRAHIAHRVEVHIEHDVTAARTAFADGLSQWAVVLIDFTEDQGARKKLFRRMVHIRHNTTIVGLIPENMGVLGFELALRGMDQCIVAPASIQRITEALFRTLTTIPVPKREPPINRQQILTALQPFRGFSEGARYLRHAIVQASMTELPVLITGETGVGKQVVARAIHESSLRAENPFIDINIAAVPETLFEAEFFGAVPGAFTGATRREGYFRSAHQGTLFLDEIGELRYGLQPKLLKAIESGEIRPVGQDKPSHADVRIISATNHTLDIHVRAGHFRRDLWYRLTGIEIHVPPLRDRWEDIPTIARMVLHRRRMNHITIRPDAFRLMQHHPWPGNVRELASVLERSVARARSNTLGARDIIFDRRLSWSVVAPEAVAPEPVAPEPVLPEQDSPTPTVPTAEPPPLNTHNSQTNLE